MFRLPLTLHYLTSNGQSLCDVQMFTLTVVEDNQRGNNSTTMLRHTVLSTSFLYFTFLKVFIFPSSNLCFSVYFSTCFKFLILETI